MTINKDKNLEHSLENGPVCRALAVETSLLLPGQDVPDDDGLWVFFGVHQWTEGHHVPGIHHNQTQYFRLLKFYPTNVKPIHYPLNAA